jgi:hypothetical protein
MAVIDEAAVTAVSAPRHDLLIGVSMAQTGKQARSRGHDVSTFSRLEKLTAVSVIGSLALLLGLFSLFRPGQVTRTETIDYTHKGSFSYAASAPDTSPYGPEGLSTGEPILADVVGPVGIRFDYQLKSEAAATVQGSASMVAEVVLPQGLSRKFDITDEKSLEGPQAKLSGTLPLRAIERYVRSAGDDLASAGFASATVTVTPMIELTGTLDGSPLESTFSPKLELDLQGSTLTIAQAPDSSASSDPESQDALKPREQAGVHFATRVTNTVPLLVASPTVPVARGIGFGLAALCLLAALWIARPLWGSGERTNENERIRTLYGTHLIEVTDLSLGGGPVARVGSMDALVDLAKKYDSKIMHVMGPEGDSYSVWDNGLLYEYRPTGGETLGEVQGRHTDQPSFNGSITQTLNGNAKAPYKAKT